MAAAEAWAVASPQTPRRPRWERTRNRLCNSFQTTAAIPKVRLAHLVTTSSVKDWLQYDAQVGDAADRSDDDDDDGDDDDGDDDDDEAEPCPADCVIEIATEDDFAQWSGRGEDQPPCRSGSHWAVLEVYSNGCRPCLGMRRPFMKSCFEHDNVQFLKLNADTLPALAQGLGVRGFPTFIVYKDGHRVDHFNASSRASLEEYLEDNVL